MKKNEKIRFEKTLNEMRLALYESRPDRPLPFTLVESWYLSLKNMVYNSPLNLFAYESEIKNLG